MEKRIDYLDSLRGLAAISVVLSHFVLAYNNRISIIFSIFNFTPLHFFFDGFAAVTLFFVLSGFVLTLSFERYPSINIIDFYVKRVLRIWPAFIITLFISFYLYCFYNNVFTTPSSSKWIAQFWRQPLSLNTLVHQLFLSFSGGNQELVPQGWSLKVEMQFSFLIPFLYILYKRTGLITYLIAIVILYFVFNISIFIVHFSMGLILALNSDKIIAYFNKIKDRVPAIVIVIISILYTYRYTVPMYYWHHYRQTLIIAGSEDFMWFISGLGAFFIIVWCLGSLKLQAILNTNILIFLGKISYSIYLTHFMILIYLVPRVIKLLNSLGIVQFYLTLALALITLLVVTIIVSYIFWRFVELNFVKLAKTIVSLVVKKKYLTGFNVANY